MSRELYINGARADIDSKTAVNQQYKSPIFSDLQKLMANTTLTIKLPLTAHNRSLIENINLVGVQSQFPQDYFRVDYVVDGFVEIENGTSYILGISDSIEVSVIFGGTSRLSKIKDAKLNEIPMPVVEGLIQWGSSWAEIGNTDGALFAYANFGYNEGGMRYVHPTVRVSQIIKWINQSYGLNLGVIDEDLAVVCTTKNRRAGYDGGLSSNTEYFPIEADVHLIEHAVSPNNPGIVYGKLFSGMQVSAGEVMLKANYSCKIAIATKIKVSNGTWGDMTDTHISECRVVSGNYDEAVMATRSDEGWFEVEILKDQLYRFFYTVDSSAVGKKYLRKVIQNFRPIDKELIYGERFDTLHNLPSIKVVDFLKAIMQIQGVFPRLQGDQIDYVSVDDLYDKLADAKDWSSKLTEVKNRSFQFLDFAQENILNWADDDTAPDRCIGSLKVNNKTIAEEREALNLPFAAVANDGQATATIPLYSDKTKEGEELNIEMENLRPRIVRLTGRFDGRIHASAISSVEVMERYEKYQQAIQTPRVVKCTMRLKPRDIAQLDLSVPVYVEQLSNHFAVINVTTRGEVSDVEMLML